MVFSSLNFVFIFIPVFFGCYYAVPKRFKNIVLLIGSLCFYFIGTLNNPEHFIVFLISIMADFAVGILMEKYPKYKKPMLAAGVIFHLISLSVFKYSGFVISEINRIVPSVALTADIVNYAVYISMFEQLIAGPIVTYPQISSRLEHRSLKMHDVLNGAGTFVFGLGLKVLLANPIGKLWSQTCAIGFESISTPLAWMAIAAFLLQIYFDFFGYSLMAVGLGKMLGFNLPKNFNHPYISRSMTEFWRRWHITLGSWFREYVYIPLGGNKKGRLSMVRNLLVVWLLTGLWHGAGYNFLLWGALLFFIIMLEKLFYGKALNRYPVIGHIYMLLLIPLTWAVFAVDDISQLGLFLSRLFPFFGQGAWSVFRYDYLKYLQMYYPFFIAGVLFSTKLPFRVLKKIKKPVIKWLLLAAVFAASVYCMYKGYDDPFLYFRF